jgi:hypothetical protein
MEGNDAVKLIPYPFEEPEKEITAGPVAKQRQLV